MLLQHTPEVTEKNAQSGFYSGQLTLEANEIAFELEAQEGEEDYWHLRLTHKVELPITKPTNRWARSRKPTHKTYELNLWYYSNKAWKCAPRKIESWDCNGEETWFDVSSDATSKSDTLLSFVQHLASAL